MMEQKKKKLSLLGGGLIASYPLLNPCLNNNMFHNTLSEVVLLNKVLLSFISRSIYVL